MEPSDKEFTSLTNLVKLSHISNWASYFWANNLKPKLAPEQDEKLFSVNPSINEKVSLYHGDITLLEVDAIVNAANSQLKPGGGVCGSIHKAAGGQLWEACEKLGKDCPQGEATITEGYLLPAKFVIHAVGPQEESPNVLRSAYQSIFNLVLSKNLKSIAIPCISTGIYGYPNEQAAHVALLQTRNFLEQNKSKVDRVIFTTYLDKDKLIYEELMQRYFPVSEKQESKV